MSKTNKYAEEIHKCAAERNKAMTWEQKLAAMQAICDVSLRMRKPGDWYVATSGRDVGGNGMLTGEYGNGETPVAAIEDDWDKLTNLPDGLYIILEAYGNRRAVRWNDYMWADVKEELPAVAR